MFVSAAEAARRAFPPDELAAALEHGDGDRLNGMVEDMERRYVERLSGSEDPARGAAARRETVEDVLLSTLRAGGSALPVCVRRPTGQEPARGAKAIRCGPGRFPFVFNRTDPVSAAWARAQAAKLVVEVASETKEAIRQIIAVGFEQGFAPRQAARQIRELVGLTRGQSRAVGNLRTRLAAGGKLSSVQIDARAARYADKLHRYRALNIARTETIRSASRGQEQLWDQAKESGLLGADAKRKWIVTRDDRLCPFCEAMQGQVVGLGEQFVSDDLGAVDGPPLHASCRCAEGIVDA